MAAKSSISMLAEASLIRIEAALGEGFVMPRQGKDEALLRAQQLAAIADYLEAQREPIANGLTAMKELKPVAVKPTKKK